MTTKQLIEAIRANDNFRNLEVFSSTYAEIEDENGDTELDLNDGDTTGWFYWFSLPGCLPDSEPFGPFDTEHEALESAYEMFGCIK